MAAPGKLMNQIRQAWQQSKGFQAALLACLFYFVPRLLLQVYVFAGMWLQYWGDQQIPVDLKIYLDAAGRFQARQLLYPQGPDRIEVFQYSPAFAWAFGLFLWLSPVIVVILNAIFHLVAYILLYVRWYKIFEKLGLDGARQMLVATLPVWLLFSSFWTDLGYLNIYIIITLLATLLIEAILEEHFWTALVWLSVILQIKPHWAFSILVPLLLGQRRFFLKLVIGAIIFYVVVSGLTILLNDPAYGWRQYQDYFRFLLNMRDYFPWRTAENGFLGYNHSLTQVVVYLLDINQTAFCLATGVKLLLLVPLVILAFRNTFNPVRLAGHQMPQLALDLAFVLYLGAFIWLDMVWELSLGIVIFPYLLGTFTQRATRIGICAVFLPYALLDPWRVFSFGLSLAGLNTITPNLYVLTDPAIYVPLIMVVILVFYALLIGRLWRMPQVQGAPA